MKMQSTQNAQNNLEREKQIERLFFPNFKSDKKQTNKLQYSRSSGIGKRINRQIHRMELRVLKKPLYLWLIDFQQQCKTIRQGKKKLFSTNGDGDSQQSHAKRVKLDPSLTSYTKNLAQNGSKANIKCIKMIQENISLKLCDLALVISFLNVIPKSKQKRKRNT